MFLPYANPVISAATLMDNVLVDNFNESRRINSSIQAGEIEDVEELWVPYQVYLMLIGDCMAREIRRRGLNVETNLILQHPQDPFPDYWKNIIVPEFINKKNIVQDSIVWGPEIYPEKTVDGQAEEVVDGDQPTDESEQSDE